MKAGHLQTATVVGLPIPPKRPAWHRYAQCRGDVHFSDRIESLPKRKRQLAAFHGCFDCPVKAQCARDALLNGDLGVVAAGVFIECKSGNGSLASTNAYERLARLAKTKSEVGA